jgi:Na+/citrate or Na+/malate symporter
MGQAHRGISEEDRAVSGRPASRAARIFPPLVAAVICTALIVEAIHTILGARANGDAMVMVCPALGGIFLSIPAAQAWWAFFQSIKNK